MAEQQEAPRPRRSVGEILRDRREELGLDLNSVGETLRIRPHYLAALEQGRSDELPGPTYVIGFVRAYSHHLGFDAEKVLARFRSESTVLQTRPDLTLPVPLGERSLPGAAVLVVAVILALCGYGTWYYLSTDERSRPERVAAVPASLRPPPDAVPAAAPPVPAVPPRAPVSAQAAAPPPAPSPPAQSGPTMASGLFANTPVVPAPDTNSAAPTTPPPAIIDRGSPTVNQPAAPRPVPDPPTAAKTQVASASPDTVVGTRVTIKAAADCWIQVRAPDQSIVFSRVLKSGETYQVPAKTGLMLRTGNAGALEIAVDGKPAPSIGGLGTLRRNVALDPDALLGGTAVHG
ncbi:MAG TPA: RodZ domain-containing protein [Stellaceae bacterium]|jgi:cytoskeleton protein RodZ|nr:RodZ domain-containing protein [Stellaceae bacterium]